MGRLLCVKDVATSLVNLDENTTVDSVGISTALNAVRTRYDSQYI